MKDKKISNENLPTVPGHIFKEVVISGVKKAGRTIANTMYFVRTENGNAIGFTTHAKALKFSQKYYSPEVISANAEEKKEAELISLIAGRALEMFRQAYNFKLDAVLDIEYAHRNIPLKLEELLKADDENFAHDILGIRRNINRETKQIENCFVPRYAR